MFGEALWLMQNAYVYLLLSHHFFQHMRAITAQFRVIGTILIDINGCATPCALTGYALATGETDAMLAIIHVSVRPAFGTCSNSRIEAFFSHNIGGDLVTGGDYLLHHTFSIDLVPTLEALSVGGLIVSIAGKTLTNKR